jgi:hypothetical protein
MFSWTFASIVWFISFPFTFEVLSTFSLMHSWAFCHLCFGKEILKGLSMDESPHSNACLKKASPHDLTSYKLVLELFFFPLSFLKGKGMTFIHKPLFDLTPLSYPLVYFCEGAFQWHVPRFPLGYRVGLGTIVVPTWLPPLGKILDFSLCNLSLISGLIFLFGLTSIAGVLASNLLLRFPKDPWNFI